MDTNKKTEVDWLTFEPRDYLREYYENVGPENLAILKFLVKTFRNLSGHERLLDFGCGPTLYALASAVNRVAEIHVCDYLECNLAEISRWLEKSSDAWDWSYFTKTTLEEEGFSEAEPSQVEAREALIRTRVTRLMKCDASSSLPIGTNPPIYDVLMTNFCAESATDDFMIWREMIHNITSLLKPGGLLLMAALDGAISYKVGKKQFPAVAIDEAYLRRMLIEVGFSPGLIQIVSVPADRPDRMYRGILMASGTKVGRP